MVADREQEGRQPNRGNCTGITAINSASISAHAPSFRTTILLTVLRQKESPQRCFMADNVDSSHEIRRRRPLLSSPTSPTSPNGVGTTENEAHAHVQAQQRAWPPPEHRSRAPEFYGFVAWTSTYLLFVIYLLWAFLPDEYIVWLGVTWYPNREWAILVPAWSVVAVLFTYFVYFALALRGTPPLDDINSITDGYTSYPKSQDGRLNYLAATEPNAIPELYDIPLSMVNRVLYLRKDPLATKQESPPHETHHKSHTLTPVP